MEKFLAYYDVIGEKNWKLFAYYKPDTISLQV